MANPDAWPYDDAAALAEQMSLRYRRHLLDSLPHPADDESLAGEPLVAYLFLLRVCIAATRELEEALESRTDQSLLGRFGLYRARAVTALNLARRNVLAQFLRHLQAQRGHELDDETLIAMAEQAIDRICEDVDEVVHPPRGP